MTLSEASRSNDGTSPQDTFKILLATDIHLGYNETDRVIGNDSFNTFEEILMLAVSRDVDFILLGGDLFHKAQPSPNSLNRCIKLLHTYALGGKEIKFVVLNEDDNQNPSFSHSMSSGVNFKDPNMNVSYPIFSIHGNHDDTVNNLSVLDLLSSTGLVNYFGKWQSLMQVNLDPIIFQKNRTKIALYGLSHIPDRRLYNLFNERKINISVPSVNEHEFFNILVLHQNRSDRGCKNFITMDLLPSNMNLIVWGHEHDCRIEPEEYIDLGKKPRYVTQPGSSVATSLCEGEAIEKKVGILNVCFNRNTNEPVFKIQTIPLKTVRPFVFKTIELKFHEEELQKFKGSARDRVEKFLSREVDEMLEKAHKLITGHPQQPKLPLIRLRVAFEESEHLLNIKRFGQKYVDNVANSGDILVFKKTVKRLKPTKVEIDEKELAEAVAKRDQVDKVEDVVEKYFNKLVDEKDKLRLFNIKCLSEVCRLIVDKADDEGARQLIQHQVDESTNYLNTHMRHIDQAREVIRQYRDEKSLEVLEDTIVNSLVAKKQPNKTRVNQEESGEDSRGMLLDSDDEDESPKTKPTRGRGSRGGRGASTRGKAAATKASTSAPKTTRGRGKKAAPAAGMSIAEQLSLRQSQKSTSSMFIFSDSD